MTVQAADPVAGAYEAAVGRLQLRRNEYRSFSETDELKARLEGRALDKVSIMAPEYRPAASADEFWDDRILEAGSRQCRAWPELRFLASLAAAARDGGAAAAVKAVRDARQLKPPQQHAVFENLKSWRANHDAARFGADGVVGQVLGEWSRQRLAEWPDGLAGDRRPAVRA